MRTMIKVVFKDEKQCMFDANVFRIEDNGFCYLEIIHEKNDYEVVAFISTSEIKYLMFVEVEE
ncbi:hypothetical protein [Anaerococcus obesiensis]|uniref:hypothetical protein n=1 Tax=Anaerococcus obesiensis TaxID=1287640 RepID=UPI00030FAB4B|nr:hypothetical protein [Anaerococcus obesiensis]